MQVVHIDTLQEIDKLEADWNASYSADSHRTVFLSWAWLRGWFEATPYVWSVLAARPTSRSPYVAFFPVGMRKATKYGIDWVRELRMGGNTYADYTGFVCPPEYEDRVIPAFAAYVKRNLRWDRFHLQDVSDPRLELFLKCFPAEGFDVRHAEPLPCLYIPLPECWDRFAQESLGRWTRRDINRFFRRMEDGREFRMALVQEGDAETQIESFLRLWKLRWEDGRDLDRECDIFRAIFRRCLQNGSLWLGVVWHGARPAAGLAALMDRRNRTFSAYIAAYDSAYAKLSPGKGLCAYGIRYAIQNGFRVFDFLRGHADYKLLFNPERRFNRNVIIRRRNLRRAAGRLVKRAWNPMNWLR